MVVGFIDQCATSLGAVVLHCVAAWCAAALSVSTLGVHVLSLHSSSHRLVASSAFVILLGVLWLQQNHIIALSSLTAFLLTAAMPSRPKRVRVPSAL